MRSKTIEISVINIAMQSPHAPSRYTELFKAAAALETSIPLRSKYAAQISCQPLSEDENPQDFIRGTIDKYFNLEKNAPWFNQTQARKAKDEELKEIQKIPDELKPSYESFPFVFHLKKHLLFLISKESKEGSLSPNQAGQFLEKLFEHPELTNRFGHTAVTVIPQNGALEWIFELDNLKKLEIDFFAPNADDDDDIEVKITRKLDEMHAKKMSTVFSARENESLYVDQETKQQARVAAKNGTVVGTGSKNNGRTETRSTEERPRIEKHTYFPSLMTRYDALIEKAGQVIKNGLTT